MATGKKKNNSQANSAIQAGIKATQPINWSDPFGTVKKGVFTPTETPEQANTRNTTIGKLDSMVSNVPTSITANDLFNNPFYQTYWQGAKSNIDNQRALDTKQLDNDLNARNQMGGSYDALRRYYQDQNYGQQYTNANMLARESAANNYLKAYQSSLQGIDALRTDQARALDMLYMPAKMATGYQGAVSGLQQAQAGLYGQQANAYYNQKTPFDNLMNIWQTTANAAASALGG